MTNFPAATSRIPDLFNLIIINKEIAALEEDILDARYYGYAEVLVNDTVFTDPTVNASVTLNVSEVGSTAYATLTEAATLPGTTLLYNTNSTTFYVEITGTVSVVISDTPLSLGGNLVLGSTTIALTNAMTLDQIVVAINTDTINTGIRASTTPDGANFKLRLTKDNVIQNNTFIIGSATTASILTELGLTANDAGYVVDLPTVAAQIGSDATVTGAGPYSLTIADASGVYLISGTSMAAIGLTSTIDLAAETIRITGHGFVSGDQVSFSSTGTLPSPIKAFPDSIYYVILVDVNTIKLATTPRNATLDTAVNITVDGTNLFTIRKTTEAEIYYQIARGYKTDSVYQERYDEVVAYFETRKYIIYSPTNATTNTTFEWKIVW